MGTPSHLVFLLQGETRNGEDFIAPASHHEKCVGVYCDLHLVCVGEFAWDMQLVPGEKQLAIHELGHIAAANLVKTEAFEERLSLYLRLCCFKISFENSEKWTLARGAEK